jgi:hypothetical protein
LAFLVLGLAVSESTPRGRCGDDISAQSCRVGQARKNVGRIDKTLRTHGISPNAKMGSILDAGLPRTVPLAIGDRGGAGLDCGRPLIAP